MLVEVESGMTTAESSTEKKTYSVDDVHKEIDGFMLSVFEAVHGHEAVTAETSHESRIALSAAKCQAILDRYTNACTAIEGLVGITKTKQEQEEEIEQLSEQCRVVRERILEREAVLVQRREDIDVKLKELLNDDVLGIKTG